MRFAAVLRLPLLAGLLWIAAVSMAMAQSGLRLDERVREGTIFDESMNEATIGFLTEGAGGTSVRMASDLSHTFDQLGKVRILAMLGKGDVQNIADIIYLRGVDISIVKLDALDYYQRTVWSGVNSAIHYITSMYEEELHVLAGSDIYRLDQLAGKRVSLDLPGSGTNLTASLVFEALGIGVVPVVMDQTQALAALRRGEIAAMTVVSGKPLQLFRTMDEAERGQLRFLSIPPVPALLKSYSPARMTFDDYPALIGPDEFVDTIAVRSVMAVFNHQPSTVRYQRVARFVEAFFSGFEGLQQGAREGYRHPKWTEVDLAAAVPGMTRFKPADEWLKKAAAAAAVAARRRPGGADLRVAFEAFLKEQVPFLFEKLSETERAQLFRRFQDWQRTAAPVADADGDGP